jgi:hypothetical protein
MPHSDAGERTRARTRERGCWWPVGEREEEEPAAAGAGQPPREREVVAQHGDDSVEGAGGGPRDERGRARQKRQGERMRRVFHLG